MHWGSERLKYATYIDDETESRQVEVSFAPTPPAEWGISIRCFNGPRRQTTESRKKDSLPESYSKAFNGVKDSSLFFGNMHPDLPKEHPSTAIPTVPNSPAVEDQPSAVHNGAVSGLCQTSVNCGKPDIQDQQGIQPNNKRKLSPQVESRSKRQRL